MTMWKKLFSIAALALVCLGMPRYSEARQGVDAPTAATVGGNVFDVWCVGKSSGSEVCVDGRGNLVPISNNEVMLGSATNRFRVAHVTSITVYGDQTVQGNLSVNGNTTLGNAPSDTLDLNVTTVTINATINGVKIGTSTSDGTYILTVDGSNRSVGVNDQTPESSFKVVALNASTTGQIVAGAASQTADLIQFTDSSASTMTRVSANGQFGLRRRLKAEITLLAPDFLGALIQCSDCTGPYTVCGATGTSAGQWANIASSTTAPGANSVKSGCGSGE